VTSPDGLRPAVFLDRDGVLNRDAPGFVTVPSGLHLLPRAARAVARINRSGLAAILATNQSGVGRGIMTAADLDAVHCRLLADLAAEGAHLDSIERCVHAPWEACDCRKPAPGMLVRAQRAMRLALDRSYMVGDKPTDIECGAAVGCTTVLVLSGLDEVYEPGKFAVQPDAVCADLWDAVGWILARLNLAERPDRQDGAHG
jgi:histidinol-phosphate phosphatase family protein